jgi:hypothetical protein
MIRNHFLLPILFALVLAACAPAETEPANVAPPTETAMPALEPPTEAAVPTGTSQPTALPVATSRGPDLHATDPATVSLASGALQFVEFFRFT